MEVGTVVSMVLKLPMLFPWSSELSFLWWFNCLCCFHEGELSVCVVSTETGNTGGVTSASLLVHVHLSPAVRSNTGKSVCVCVCVSVCVCECECACACAC